MRAWRGLVGVVGMMGLLGASSVVAQPASPIPNDPFQSVAPPAPRPAPRPAPQAQPGGQGQGAPQGQRPAAQRGGGRSGFPVGVGQSFRDCPECPEMVVIPAGQFTMGSPESEPGRFSSEGPQREVFVRSSLAVGKFEVTFGEWDACVSAGGCSHRPNDFGWGRGRQPVVDVSWEDAQQYVRWLSSRTGRTYRLLTEAEWEYAARGGTTTPYSFGWSISPSQANYSDSRLSRTTAVGSYAANRFGLHDMHGNVWEWVEDCWGSYSGAPTDASIPVTGGGCSSRVLRGGSCNGSAQGLRSANRGLVSPGIRLDHFGFRVARTPGG
jgi:formylglycine-generating enzyme required for sulfatase activity